MLLIGGSVPFPFGTGGSVILANCSLCGTEATIFFSEGPVCSSFSAEACAILQALYLSRQHQQVCHFYIFSSNLTVVLSSPPCPLLHLSFYLKLSGRNFLLLFFAVLSSYNGSPDTRSSRETPRLMSWPNGSATYALCNSFQLLSSYLSYPLFSFLGLEAYCLIEILRHTGSVNFHLGTCAP